MTGDPRLAKYALPTGASQKAVKTACDITYRGFPNGHSSADVKNPCDPAGKNFSFSDYSRPTLSIRLEGSPSYIMTYSELLFIKAEAAERGFITGSASQFYTDAITASMQQWGVAAADMVQIDLQLNWTRALGGQAQSRSVSTIVAKNTHP